MTDLSYRCIDLPGKRDLLITSGMMHRASTKFGNVTSQTVFYKNTLFGTILYSWVFFGIAEILERKIALEMSTAKS